MSNEPARRACVPLLNHDRAALGTPHVSLGVGRDSHSTGTALDHERPDSPSRQRGVYMIGSPVRLRMLGVIR